MRFPYPLPEPWVPEVAELKASITDHPSCRWVLQMYSRHRGTSTEIGARAQD